MGHILDQIFPTTQYIIEKHDATTDNPLMIYVNKIENRIMFKIKIG